MAAIQICNTFRKTYFGDFFLLYTDDPIETPATFETPQIDSPDRDTDSLLSSTRSRKRKTLSTISVTSSKAPSDGHSIDSFLANYTSEDNNSFQELIETADRKLRQKFAVLYEAEQNTAAAIAHSLELPSIENQYKAIEGTKQVDMWTYTNKNYIMYVPDGVELTKEEQLEMATNKQEIEYSNTRLRQNPFDDLQSKETITEMAREQAKVISGRIGVDGNSLNKSNKTPNIRGFNFVHTPSATPIIDGSASPLMTWGELEGSPFRLDGSDTPYRASSLGPAFRIHETSRRENIALELAEKAGKRLRDQKTKALEAAKQNIGSPHIRSSIDRLAAMSPAAKRLATNSLGLRDLSPSGSGSRSKGTPLSRDKSWTPKTKSATPSPLVRKKTATDIGVSSEEKPSKAPDENRTRAADFF